MRYTATRKPKRYPPVGPLIYVKPAPPAKTGAPIAPNDNSLSCEELSNEISLANKYADEAKEAKKMDKPHNIGAILFFIPGYGVSMKNIDQAITAAAKRAEHLNNIKEKKNC